MRDYGKISTSIWNSRKFRALPTDDSKMLYFYLHTCTHVNSVGCFILREGYAAEDLGWDRERYQKGIETLSEGGLIQYDDHEKLVRIVNFFRFDPFANVNHAKGAVKLALALPDCHLKVLLLKEISGVKFADKLPEIANGIETLSKQYRTPEPEPEPEPYSEAEASGADAPHVDPTKVLFDSGVRILGNAGISAAKARAILGKWRKDHGDEAVIAALGKAQREGAVDPVAFCEGVFRFTKSNRGKPLDGETRTLDDGTLQTYSAFDGWKITHV